MPPKSILPLHDSPPRSLFYDTVPKWGPTVFTGVMAATLLAGFVVVTVMCFIYVGPLANRVYTVTDIAGNDYLTVREMANTPYPIQARNVLNSRADSPGASILQTMQIVPKTIIKANELLELAQSQMSTGVKFEYALVKALREFGLGEPGSAGPAEPEPVSVPVPDSTHVPSISSPLVR